jgi:hypothetical protein
MFSQIGIDTKIVADKTKSRPQDIQELRGDNTKIKKPGFKDPIAPDKTIKDSLEWWMKQI